MLFTFFDLTFLKKWLITKELIYDYNMDNRFYSAPQMLNYKQNKETWPFFAFNKIIGLNGGRP